MIISSAGLATEASAVLSRFHELESVAEGGTAVGHRAITDYAEITEGDHTTQIILSRPFNTADFAAVTRDGAGQVVAVEGGRWHMPDLQPAPISSSHWVVTMDESGRVEGGAFEVGGWDRGRTAPPEPADAEPLMAERLEDFEQRWALKDCPEPDLAFNSNPLARSFMEAMADGTTIYLDEVNLPVDPAVLEQLNTLLDGSDPLLQTHDEPATGSWLFATMNPGDPDAKPAG